MKPASFLVDIQERTNDLSFLPLLVNLGKECQGSYESSQNITFIEIVPEDTKFA
ncbi:hypothetical protein AVDCRST_MAG92-4300 [uncultured Coleofasciculus sp.]|uniref:Uncharacterized protein n=1 Tax=uncultured Coleofasciculus sp. TaxID=1267456 RepID=A0A6J4JZD3_9CYAN|nr:hypothetical protein AVDCRST_MAG92-4300 [uncultured Coleofasciculus sp.]